MMSILTNTVIGRKRRTIVAAVICTLVVLSLLLLTIRIFPASAETAGAAAHLRTSYNDNNYVEFSIDGSSLTVTGIIDADNLASVCVTCGEDRILKSNAMKDAEQSRPFSVTVSMKQCHGIFPVDLYTKLRTEKSYRSITGGHFYVTENNGVYSFTPSAVAQNNTSLRDHWANPADYLSEDIPEKVRKLSDSITAGAKSDYEKLLLLHKWTAGNIYYDYDYFLGVSKKTPLNTEEIIDKKCTVCYGYASLMQQLVQAQGIPCMMVDSDALGLGSDNYSFAANTARASITQSNHTHNEAYVDGRWIVMDTTWDSKNRYENGKYIKVNNRGWYYFDMTPEFLDLSHKIISYGEGRWILSKDQTLPKADPKGTVPSGWAKKEVEKALIEKIVPANLMTGFQNDISRQDFCRLLIQMLCVRENVEDAAALLKKNGIAMRNNLFDDTDDESVCAAYLLGIVNGTGSGGFSPNEKINREQAACMLTRAAQKIGIKQNRKSINFSDGKDASPWALDDIAFVSGLISAEGSIVMSGTIPSCFSPKASYSVEQSILAVYRLLLCQ